MFCKQVDYIIFQPKDDKPHLKGRGQCHVKTWVVKGSNPVLCHIKYVRGDGWDFTIYTRAKRDRSVPTYLGKLG